MNSPRRTHRHGSRRLVAFAAAALALVLVVVTVVHGAATRYARTADEALRDHAIYNALNVAANYRRLLTGVAARIGRERPLPDRGQESTLLRAADSSDFSAALHVSGTDTSLVITSHDVGLTVPLTTVRTELLRPYPQQVLDNLEARLARSGRPIAAGEAPPLGVRVWSADSVLLFALGNVSPMGRFWSARVAMVGTFAGDVEFLITERALTTVLPYGVPPSPWMLSGASGLIVALIAVVAIAAAVRADQLSRARLQFTSTVSHELRTPLANIQLFADTLLLERAPREIDQRMAVRTIASEASRLRALVDNVLVQARTEHRVSRQEESLQALVSEVIAPFALLLAQRRMTVCTQFSPPDRVRVDADALRQVLVNLLDNAIRHGPDDQVIRIETRHEPGRVVVIVADEGAGIPDADRERLWRPFERDAGGGTGLGLSVVHDLAVANAGSARFLSPACGAAVEVAFAVDG